MTHGARLAGLTVAVIWSIFVGIAAACLLYARQYDATILACVTLIISMFLLLVYLWDTVRALGFKEADTKRYKSEVDFLTGKVTDLEYARRTVYAVFRNRDANARGELVSLHEVLFQAKYEARQLNQANHGPARTTMAHTVYAIQIKLLGDVTE